MRTACEADRVVLSASASGPGIPDELAARLYQPFSVGDASYDPGLGLGLEIVQALGGTIGLKNRHANGRVIGLGATVRLPLVQNIP